MEADTSRCEKPVWRCQVKDHLRTICRLYTHGMGVRGRELNKVIAGGRCENGDE